MDILLPDERRSTWFLKFSECILGGIAFGNILGMLTELLPEKWTNQLSESVQYIIYFGTMGVPALIAIIYSVYWHRKEKQRAIDSLVRHAWFRALIRYWLALEIATYGFAKILGTQFAHSYHRDDTPAAQLSGFSLTWNYFSYSYTMAVIIAMVQIIGACLLLFRKTTLLGVTILLPVMLNILLINIFYSIALGAFINSVLFSVALIYLLSLQWKPLKQIYLHSVSILPEIKIGIWKRLIQVLCIGGAFMFIYSYVLKDEHSPLEGKWKIVSLQKNGVPVKDGAWLTDSTAWSNVYFETYGSAVFCANPYVFDQTRVTWTRYKLDTAKKTLTFDTRVSEKKHDTTIAKLIAYSAKTVEWQGRFGKDTMQVKMERVEKRR